MKSFLNFLKKRNLFKNEFLIWKLNQLYRTENVFVLLLSAIHAIYIYSDFSRLFNSQTLIPTFQNVTMIILLRLVPITLFLIIRLLFKDKKINITIYTIISNFIMIFIVAATGLTKYYVPKPTDTLGFIFIDSIAVIMATIFSAASFSIINLISCLIIIFTMGYIVPNSWKTIEELLTNLVPFGICLCIAIFSVDKYFRRMYEYIQKINSMALEDNLTGLYNRNILKEKVFDKLTERCKYSGSMIMVDIDHFKLINDNHGHQTGDFALCRLAAVLNENIRKEDYIVRFGGEEFLIIFKDLTLEEAVAIAERIRKQVESMDFFPSFTISCGISTFKEGSRFETVTAVADDKLYKAKETGRNKVCY